MDVTLRLRKVKGAEEWEVQYLVGGKYDESKGYFTPDIGDALDTMVSMREEAYRQGADSVEVKTYPRPGWLVGRKDEG